MTPINAPIRLHGFPAPCRSSQHGSSTDELTKWQRFGCLKEGHFSWQESEQVAQPHAEVRTWVRLVCVNPPKQPGSLDVAENMQEPPGCVIDQKVRPLPGVVRSCAPSDTQSASDLLDLIGGYTAYRGLQPVTLPTRQYVNKIVSKERDCDGFTLWQQGFSPKEHAEMIQAAYLEKLRDDREERREREERIWKSKETRFRYCEIIGVIVLAPLVAWLIPYLGSLAEKPEPTPPPTIVTPIINVPAQPAPVINIQPPALPAPAPAPVPAPANP